MASQATAKTELFARWMGGNLVIADQGKSTGSRFWVSSDTGTDGAGYGMSPNKPFATIDYAIGKCTADVGDVIYVMPGHTETIDAATDLVADIAGISIVGLGAGSDRPTLTLSTAATASVVISAANVLVQNILFVCGTDGINGGVTVSGNDVTFVECEFRDATDVEADIWIDASGDRLTVKECFFNGYTGGDQQEAMIDLDACDNVLIQACRFIGKVITACVNISVASTNLVVKDSVFYRATTTDLSLTVVDTATGSTWAVENCFDLGAGCGFSGGSGAALAKDDASAIAAAIATIDPYFDVPTADAATNTLMRDVVGNKTDAAATVAANKSLVAYAKQTVNQVQKLDAAALGTITAGSLGSYLPRCVEKADGAVLLGNDDLFTISGGPVRAKIVGYVSTLIGGAANGRLKITTTTPAATVDLNAGAVAIDADAAGTVYYNVGATSVFTPVTAGAVILDPVTVEETEFLLPPGTVHFNSSAAQDGVIKWYMTYWPLSPNSLVTAAA